MSNNNIWVQGYLASESHDEDVIKVKRIYIDICDGNVHDALILSQIMYWHRPGGDGKPRLRIERKGHLWLAKSYSDWWNECRVNEYTARKSIARLSDSKGGKNPLIIKGVWRFNGSPTVHIRMNWHEFERRITQQTNNPPVQGSESKRPDVAERNDTQGHIHNTQHSKSLTENTSKITTKNDSAKAANATYLDTWTQYGGYVDRTALELLQELNDTSLTEQHVTAAFAGSRYLSRKLLADMARRPDCYGLAADLIAQAPDSVSTVKYEDALRIATTLIHEHSITDAQTVLDRLVAYKRDNNLPQGGLRMLERPEVSGYTKTAPRNTQKDYEPEPEISPEQRRENIESMRQAVQDMEGASA